MRMREKLLNLVVGCSFFFTAAMAHAAKPATLMYVANEDENSVMVVNLDTEQILATLSTGNKPHAVVFAGGNKAYINNRGSHYLTVIDTERLEVSGIIPLQATSFQLSLSPDGETLAVSYKDALMVSLVDVASNLILATIPIGETPADGFPEKPMKHPHWNKDGSYLYVQNNIENKIVIIDPVTFTIVGEIAMPGSNHDLVPSANGETLYAINQNTDTGTSLTVIDAVYDFVITDITIPLLPGEVGFGHHGDLSPNGKTFYFCNEGGYSVTLVDTVNMQVIKSLIVGNGAGHPVFSNDNQKVFILAHKDNIVAVIDVSSQEVIANISAGVGKQLAHSSHISADGKYLYVINVIDQNILKIDTGNLNVISTIAIGKKALSFGVTTAQL